MTQYLEDAEPIVKYAGLNTAKAASFESTAAFTGAVTMASTLAVTGASTLTGATTITGAVTPTGGVAAAGGFSVSPRTFHTGGMAPSAITSGDDTAFTTTVTYFAEVFVPANATVTGVRVLMGTAAGNGNISVALANSSGTVVASSATTTTSGTQTTYTQVAFSTTYAAVGPATYWVLVQGSNTSDKIRTIAAAPAGTGSKTAQTYGTFTSITPTTTWTTGVGPTASLY